MTTGQKFQVGDVVQYTKAWLQSVTGGHPHQLWTAKGRVVSQEGRWISVLWEGELDPILVAPENIAKLGTYAATGADAKGWTGYAVIGEKKSPWSIR